MLGPYFKSFEKKGLVVLKLFSVVAISLRPLQSCRQVERYMYRVLVKTLKLGFMSCRNEEYKQQTAKLFLCTCLTCTNVQKYDHTPAK